MRDVYWKLLQGDLQCKDCDNWEGDITTTPCKDFNPGAFDTAEGCPQFKTITEEEGR